MVRFVCRHHCSICCSQMPGLAGLAGESVEEQVGRAGGQWAWLAGVGRGQAGGRAGWRGGEWTGQAGGRD
jgi:hypothetical protein